MSRFAWAGVLFWGAFGGLSQAGSVIYPDYKAVWTICFWLFVALAAISAIIWLYGLLHRRAKGARTQQPATTAVNPPFNRPLQYLNNRDEALSNAVKALAWNSAWGKWWQSQHLAMNDRRPVNEFTLMCTAAGQVTQKAMDGALEIRGRPPGKLDPEVISPDRWRLMFIAMDPDDAALWKATLSPKGTPSEAEKAEMALLLGYRDLMVDAHRFEEIWPRHDRVTDAHRDECLRKARALGVPEAEIDKLRD
jgi:hypothetical protein